MVRVKRQGRRTHPDRSAPESRHPADTWIHTRKASEFELNYSGPAHENATAKKRTDTVLGRVGKSVEWCLDAWKVIMLKPGRGRGFNCACKAVPGRLRQLEGGFSYLLTGAERPTGPWRFKQPEIVQGSSERKHRSNPQKSPRPRSQLQQNRRPRLGGRFSSTAIASDYQR
eukprot:3469678-Pyramimonas_sp.AAC.1